MRRKKLRWEKPQPRALPRKRFGPLLGVEKNDGGRGRADYNQAADRAKMGLEGADCYSSSGLALPCGKSKR